MDSYAVLVILALALMVSATPVPPDFPSWRQGPVAAVKEEEPKPVAIAQTAQDRKGFFEEGGGYGWASGAKLPFDLISGPYQSSIGKGFSLPGGYGGLGFDNTWGIPLIGNGPLGGVMGIPMMMLLG